MEQEYYYLWEEEKTPHFNPEFGQNPPRLKPYLLHNGKKNGCIIVCPGGGYVCKADHEGGSIAEMLNQKGVSAFVLDYRVAPYTYPAITEDLIRAIRYVRYHAEEMSIDEKHIGVLGFSAGGHLCVSSLCLYDSGREDGDLIDRVSSRPDAAVLCYPVVTLTGNTHAGSLNQLLCGVPNAEEMKKKLSGELNVTPDTPPCFIWHTAEDATVPVTNSIDMYRALCENGVFSELHIFPHGWHGLGLAPQYPEVAVWPDLLATWLDGLGFVTHDND